MNEDNKQQGWICLYRSLQNHWLWEDTPFSRGQAWIDLLLMAKHAPQEFLDQTGKVISGEVGYIYRSERSLAERWGWSRKKTSYFLKILDTSGMIKLVKKRASRNTTIFIVNYEEYQQNLPNEEPVKNRKRTTASTSGEPVENIYNNVNNDNNNKNIYAQNFRIIWDHYPKKKEKAAAYKAYQARLNEGYSEEELLKATKAYAQECKDRRTAEQYIKSPKTFFGPNAPFTDYLKGDEKTDDEPEYKIAADYYRQWGYNGPGDED